MSASEQLLCVFASIGFAWTVRATFMVCKWAFVRWLASAERDPYFNREYARPKAEK